MILLYNSKVTSGKHKPKCTKNRFTAEIVKLRLVGESDIWLK